MCGIAGKLAINEDSAHIQVVRNMCKRIAHRGPDGEGVQKIDNVVLGHRRLAIIDLSASANQPMKSVDNNYHIVFNGEIYNFQEIKKGLLAGGYQFKTNSDTEVILNAYAEYGTKCFEHFRGMFSLALWDGVKKQLVLARDHFGKKPFFYTYDKEGSFTFCSELTGLQVDDKIDFELNYEAINAYFALGYILNPATMYRNIYQLEPGTCMVLNHEGKIISKQSFWDYSAAFRVKTKDSEADMRANIITLIDEAVRKRMISDVPVGAFLSGGIDSSSIVSLMKKHHQGELHTFSVGFRQESYNEFSDADRRAKWAGTVHHGMYCEDVESDPIALMDEAISAFDQVFCDNSLIPMVEVSRLARKNVTVVLSGDGADELFAGYITYKADKLHRYASKFPHFLRKMLMEGKIGFTKDDGKKIGRSFKQKQFFNGALHDYKKAHYLWRQFFSPEERVALMGEKYRDLIYDTDPWHEFEKHYKQAEGMEVLDQHLYVDAKTWLVDDILVKVDRSSMHSSIEARAPYLDLDLATYVASIPSSLKMKGLTTKYVLKQALLEAGVIPAFVVEKKKSGFNAPVGAWLGVEPSQEFKAFNKYVFDKKVVLREF